MFSLVRVSPALIFSKSPCGVGSFRRSNMVFILRPAGGLCRWLQWLRRSFSSRMMWS